MKNILKVAKHVICFRCSWPLCLVGNRMHFQIAATATAIHTKYEGPLNLVKTKLMLSLQ